MPFEKITLEKKGRLAFITLSLPKKMNALGVAMQKEIVKAIEEIEVDEEIRVGIIRGQANVFRWVMTWVILIPEVM